MEKVYVMDNRGRETEAFKIRYFEYQGIEYFIYTLGEIDKDEYVKLYLKKLINGEEQIITEDDWIRIRDIIQKVVKEIKNGEIKSFKDLNMTSLNEIMENDTRVFKLKKNIVEQIVYEEPKVEIKEEQIVKPSIKEEEAKKEKSYEDTFIASLEDSIKSTFADDLKPMNKEIKTEPKVDNSSSRIKPIVVGTVKNEYKEKCESLEKELENYKIIVYKLKEENDVLKGKIVEYHTQVEKLKEILKDI